MNGKTIIYPPSMPMALWVLVVTMTVAVYMASVSPEPYRPQPRIEISALPQFQPELYWLPIISDNESANKPDPEMVTADHTPEAVAPGSPAPISAKPAAAVSDLPPRPATTSQLDYVKKSERLYHPIILQAASRYQVDPAIVKAIIMAESSYNPKAVSKRGARGLMQLMPKTAEEMGVEDIFNPEHNINGGVRYHKKLLNKFKGDIKLALAAYNAGMSKVREHNGVPPYKSTRHYIKKVFEYYQYYKNQLATDQA
ncbi:MAG: lytic transglycosylase domain-containing protein [Planctomycetota bacterium]|jgi:soluble lytic murein transglycosylase-like protein